MKIYIWCPTLNHKWCSAEYKLVTKSSISRRQTQWISNTSYICLSYKSYVCIYVWKINLNLHIMRFAPFLSQPLYNLSTSISDAVTKNDSMIHFTVGSLEHLREPTFSVILTLIQLFFFMLRDLSLNVLSVQACQKDTHLL